MVLDEVGSIGHERSITRKKTGGGIGIKKIHISGAPPAIYAIPISLVCGSCCSNCQFIEGARLPRCERYGVFIPLSAEPFRYGWWREQGNIRRQGIQGVEGKMIRVSVRQHNRVQLRKGVKGNSRGADSWKKFSEGWIEVGVSKETFPADLN
jgi:hypothetical protein